MLKKRTKTEHQTSLTAQLVWIDTLDTHYETNEVDLEFMTNLSRFGRKGENINSEETGGSNRTVEKTKKVQLLAKDIEIRKKINRMLWTPWLLTMYYGENFSEVLQNQKLFRMLWVHDCTVICIGAVI